MISLGQKLKMIKTCEKWVYKDIIVVLRKKTKQNKNKERLEKAANIQKSWRF